MTGRHLDVFADTDTGWMRSNLAPLLDADYAHAVTQRLLANIEVSPTGCWEWKRFIHPDGYGKISVKRRMVNCHRVARFLLVGPWDPALQLDHLCRNRACCNPAHLEPVTSAENTRRGNAAALAGQRQRAKTHCPQGHAYDEKNTYWSPNTGRMCRRCRADGAARAKRRAKAS